MTTKKVLALLAALAMLALVAPTTPASANGCTVDAHLVPSCGALWGFSATQKSVAQYTADELALGRHLDIVYNFHKAGDTLPTADERTLVAGGHFLHVNIETPNVQWTAITAGIDDVKFAKQAKGLASLGVPVFLTYDHEPDAHTKYGKVGDGPAYVAAWRHVHDVFVANGATNAVWTWIGSGWKGFFPYLGTLYPGNDVVDWIAWEAYSTTACSATRRNILAGTFYTAASPMYDWLQTVGGPTYGIDLTKPMMIAEYGAVYDSGVPAAQGNWYANIPTTLATSFPLIKAVVKWDNQGGNCNYWDQISPLTLAGEVAGGQDPYVNPLLPAGIGS
jgi:hypothetical protein